VTKPGLLLVRIFGHWSAQIAKNPEIAKNYETVALCWAGAHGYDPSNFAGLYQGIDHGGPGAPEGIVALTREIIQKHNVRKCIILTPLYWFSNAVKEALDEAEVDTIWSEVFPDNRIILDRAGCQYTADNDIVRHAPAFPDVPADPPKSTRFRQPDARTPAEIRAAAKIENGQPVVVVLGQVPGDHALLDTTGGMNYYRWLHSIFTKNPNTAFLFKQHPAGKNNVNARTKNIEMYHNVRIVDESIFSLFLAFDAFAAFSSTAIMEGVIQGKAFATGGHHFINHPDLCLRLSSPEDAENLYEKIRAFKSDDDLRKRWIAFLTRGYTMRPSSPLLSQRLAVSSGQFFGQLGYDLENGGQQV